jgi:ABC-type hemin transport system substrate-binding protein
LISRVARTLSLLVAGLAVLGCTADRERAEDPPRLLSFSPPITRILVQLGEGAHIVGVDPDSRRISGLGAVRVVAEPSEADPERLVELHPTLAFAVRDEAHRALFETLRAGGIEVREFAPTTMADVVSIHREISALVGRASEADALVLGLKRDLAGISVAVRGGPRPNVALVVRREPLSVAGRGSLLHDMIEIAGGQNLFESFAAPATEITLEALEASAPDVLIDASLTGAPDATERGFWSRFAWVRRVEYLPGRLVSLPALNVVRRARAIQERLYPGGVNSDS